MIYLLVRNAELEEERNRAGKNEEPAEMPAEGVASLLLFGVSMLMWLMALYEINGNSQLCSDIQHLSDWQAGLFDYCWRIICLMWQASLWFKLWLVTAVASTAMCWAIGGFLSLCMLIPSFWVSAAISLRNSEELTSVSLGTWLFIVGMNIVVFILWLIVVGIKEHLAEKKEVLPER